MKILHIAPFYLPAVGGMESFLSNFLSTLAERGHESHILTSHQQNKQVEETKIGPVFVYRTAFIFGLAQKKPALILQSKIFTEKLINRLQPDLIHMHVGGPVPFLYKSARNAINFPLLLTIYDLLDDLQSETLAYAASHAKQITAISQARYEDCKQLFPTEHDKIKRVYVSTPIKKPAIEQTKFPNPTLLMVGRQVPEKGFDFALELVKRVKVTYLKVQLIMVGDGPVHEKLKAYADALGIQENVNFTGQISDEALSTLYAKAWMTLVPSLHSESFGLVALEAMQAGCVVVASRVGGLQEVVVNGETGITVSASDQSAWEAAILKLIGNPAELSRLGKAGKKRATQEFDWTACVAAYEKIYREIIVP